MGPARTDLSNHSDSQITDPKLQLAAHAARAAKLHARLMATLDTLDSERRAYADEISDERRQRVALQAQLRAARAERAAMEAERDSLREAVLHLIEKVEVCNDYSLWPHSGLELTSLAVQSKPHEQPHTTWTAAARAYSAALLTVLREECERERAAHSAALRRVAELEAQLARREAELEERYETAPTPAPAPCLGSPIPPLSRNGAIRVLQQSAARNEALTHEIAGLVQKLEGARATLKRDESSPPDRSAMTLMPSTPLPLPPTPPLNRASTPESPTPQRGPALAPSPPPLVRSPKPSSPTPAARHPLRDTSLPTDFARQIAAVTEDLAGLRAEEQRLSQMQLERPRQQQEQQDALPRASTPPWRTFRRILLVEEECIRLRAELAASVTREAALRELLVPALETLPMERDLLSDHGDEDGVEMDLATPLQPTVLLNLEDLWPG